MKYLIYSCIVLLYTIPSKSHGQFTLNKGTQVLEIGAAFSSYYNYRIYPSNNQNFKKNRFRLRDAQLRIEFRNYHSWETRLDIDFAGLLIDPDEDAPTANPLVNDAYITYKAPFGVDFTLGYQKVMFSRGSITPIFKNAFIDRPALTDGSIFHRRDLGLTAQYAFWKQRVRLYTGIFNGLGAISRNNDPSGSLSWMGRADISYPARYRYNDIDRLQVPIPMLTLGTGIYGIQKRENLILDDQYILGVNGRKIHYGIDASFQYMGLSIQAEWLQARATPRDSMSFLLEAKPTNYVSMGGFLIGLNYYIKPIKTSFSLRYNELNPNDLRLDDEQKSLSFGVIHYLEGQNTALRAEYHHRLNNWKLDDFRMTLQYLIW